MWYINSKDLAYNSDHFIKLQCSLSDSIVSLSDSIVHVWGFVREHEYTIEWFDSIETAVNFVKWFTLRSDEISRNYEHFLQYNKQKRS